VSRADRLAKFIKEEISKILREDVSDPRIGFVSITDVDLSPDFENANIFVSIFGDEDKKKQAMKGLDSATRFIRGKLGHVLELREVPKILFVRDDSLEKGSKVLGIITKLEKEERERNTRHPKKSA
jgi:ribosome-binding factor A